MRIAIVAAGSRGDAEPFLALALGLRQRGHEPIFLGHPEFGARAQRVGVPFRPMPGDPREILATRAGVDLMSARSPVTVLKELRGIGEGLFDDAAAALERELLDCDAVVFSTLAVAAYHVAEKYRMPRIWAVLQPVTATEEWPSLLLPVRGQRATNRITHRVADRMTWAAFGPATMRYRDRAGLPPVSARTLRRRVSTELPTIGGWSPVVAPRPADWPLNVQVTGAWQLVDDRPLDPEVQNFLDAGEPPVYLGLGSAVVADPVAVTDMFVKAARLVGVRLVLSSGWAGLGRGTATEAATGADVLVIGDAPHRSLFSQCAAVGHHCGAGTTHTALAAGAVTIPLPMWGDQPFWASRVHNLGVAVAPVPQHEWTIAKLAGALASAVGEPWRSERARTVGAKIAVERGADRAAGLVTDLVMARSSP